MVTVAVIFGIRMFRKADGDTKKKINAVVLVLCCFYATAKMLPLTWKAQLHRERTRSMDVRFTDTSPDVLRRPDVASFLKNRPQSEKAFAQVIDLNGHEVVAMVNRQSNRSLEPALNNLLNTFSAKLIDAGDLGGRAGCTTSGTLTTCGWVNFGVAGRFTSTTASAEEIATSFADLRPRFEQRVDRYHPYAEGFSFALMVFGIMALIIACTASHELSHASLARLVGCDVMAICIGAGRILFDRDVRGVRVLIKAIPLGGYVQNVHRGAGGYRWRQAIISAAGPVENFALAIMFATFFPITHPTVVLNLAMGLLNLVPISKYIPEAGMRIGTDGYQFIQVLTGKRKYNPASVIAIYEVRAEAALERNLPDVAREWVEKGLSAHPENECLLELRERVSLAA